MSDDFKEGDLVVHRRGWIYPQGKIRGVVVECEVKDAFGIDAYKVFWYTTQQYQIIRGDVLMHMQEALDKQLEQLGEKNVE